MTQITEKPNMTLDVRSHETTVFHQLEICYGMQEYSVKYCVDDMLYGEIYSYDNDEFLDSDSALYDAVMRAAIGYIASNPQ
mgnify:CR=1 FL=1